MAGGMARLVRLPHTQLGVILAQHFRLQSFPRVYGGLGCPHLLSSGLLTWTSVVGGGTGVSTGKGVELLASASGSGDFERARLVPRRGGAILL